MTRVVILLLLLAGLTMPQHVELFDLHLEQFNVPYASFYRAFHGCPPDAASAADCRPHLAKLDRKQFDRARSAAMKLFELESK